jgi:hypothetical protein
MVDGGKARWPLPSICFPWRDDGSEVRVETSKMYRQQAVDCLQFANEASDAYVKIALTELSIEFLRKAEAAEQAADKPTDENLGERV